MLTVTRSSQLMTHNSQLTPRGPPPVITPHNLTTPQPHNLTSPRVPRVSVVMPVHNGATYLEEAIESILRQTFTNLETLVVDDGSTDATPEILRTLAASDPRLSVFTQDHRGITHSRNRGIASARGEYLAAHDADDLSLPDRLEKQVSFLDAHPEVAMVGSVAQWIDQLGNPIPSMGYPTEHEEIVQKLPLQSCFVHGSVLFRHSCLLAAGAYREEFPLAEDVDLFLRLSERYRVANLPDILYHWRRSDQSVSIRQMSLLQKYFKVAVELAKQRHMEGRDLLSH